MSIFTLQFSLPEDVLRFLLVEWLSEKVKVSIFETNQNIGSTIINAVTGIPYYNDTNTNRLTVGSNRERELFKVKDVSGKAILNRVTGKAILLFYDNPSQYERHLLTIAAAIEVTYVTSIAALS